MCRDLEVGQAFRHEVSNFLFVDALPCVRNDDRFHFLSHLRVVNTKHCNVHDRRMFFETVFDFDRVDVLAATDDQVAKT